MDSPPILVRRLAIVGGVVLAALAGYVNVVTLQVFAVPVSHMSGAVARVGTDMATGDTADMSLILLILLGFFAGAGMSGVIIGGPQLQPGRRYGVVMVLEATLVAAAAFLLHAGLKGGVPLAALACGAQNAMASSYYGLIVRTTHVTGIITDLGVIAGQRLRGVHVEGWKPVLLTGLLAGFLAGAMAGQTAVDRMGPGALGVAAMAYLVGGAGYYTWRTASGADWNQT